MQHISSSFIPCFGRLAEMSSFSSDLPGVYLELEEHPGLEEDAAQLIKNAGLVDPAGGKRCYEASLELPTDDATTIVASVTRYDRDAALAAGESLARHLQKAPLAGKFMVKLIGRQNPCVLIAYGVDAGIGDVQVCAGGDTYHDAFSAITSWLPGAYHSDC